GALREPSEDAPTPIDPVTSPRMQRESDPNAQTEPDLEEDTKPPPGLARMARPSSHPTDLAFDPARTDSEPRGAAPSRSVVSAPTHRPVRPATPRDTPVAVPRVESPRRGLSWIAVAGAIIALLLAIWAAWWRISR